MTAAQRAAYVSGAAQEAAWDLNDHLTVLLSAVALAKRIPVDQDSQDQCDKLDAADLAAHRCAHVAQALLGAVGGRPKHWTGKRTSGK